MSDGFCPSCGWPLDEPHEGKVTEVGPVPKSNGLARVGDLVRVQDTGTFLAGIVAGVYGGIAEVKSGNLWLAPPLVDCRVLKRAPVEEGKPRLVPNPKEEA